MEYLSGKLEPKFIYLATPDRRLYGVLNGVDENSVSVTENANNTNSLSFTVYKNIDGKPSAFYDNIDVLMRVFVDNEWYIINEAPQIDHDGIKEYKTVSAESAEIELSNYDLATFLVGQGTEASCEMMYYNKHQKDFPVYEKDSDGNTVFDSDGNPKVKYSFPVVKFCDKDNPELSLLHLALYYAKLIPETITTDEDGNEVVDWVSNIDKSPWQIGHIDTLPKEYIDYTVSFEDEGSIGKTRVSYLPEESYAFNIDNSDLYSFLTQDVAGAFNCVFVFDTVNCLINAYYVEHIGADTNAYIGWRNVQNSVTATNTDDLYTAYTVSGGDGLTGIEQANFGSSEIEDYSYFMKDNRYLPQSLIDKYREWLKFRESKRDSYVAANKNYWKAYDKAAELMARVPSDSSTQDWTTKSLEDLMSFYDDFTAMIRGYEKLYVDKNGNFDIDALKNSSSWNNYCEILNYTIPTIVNEIAKKKTDKTELPEELKSYGGGNLLSNAVFMTSSDWNNIENTLLDIKDIDSSPAYGITRYATVSSSVGTTGIKQSDISVEKNMKYTLSAFVRSSSSDSVQLGYSTSSGDPVYTGFSLSSGWTRMHISFTAQSNKCNVYFSVEPNSKGNNSFDICGTMLEIGESPSSFNYFELDENYLKSCNTNWDLYGTKELEIYLEDYSNRLKFLSDYSEEYENADTDYSEETYNIKHQLYLDYKKLYDACNKALEQRTAEYNTAVEEYKQYNKEMLDIKIMVQRENYTDKFTDDEENMLKKIYRHTDYTNENVITTDITTTDTTVDKQYALYLDAVENLYASAHPQYSYSDTLDNVYPLEEYKSLVKTLHVYDYVHVEVSEFGHFESLRIISITRNPCIYNGTLQVEFSTVRQYKSKRNDFTSLLGSAVSAAKNSITMNSSTSDKTASYTITPEFIKAILGSSGFSNYTSGIQSSTVDAVTGNFTNLYAKYIDADQIVAKLIKADSAEFKTLVSESIQTDILTAKILNADEGFFKELTAQLIKDESGNIIIDLINNTINASTINSDVAHIKNLLSGSGEFGDLQSIHLTVANSTIDEAVIKELIAAKISVADLMTHSATAELITLISQDGNPAIAFKGATQQFYDSDGNVRIQMGQDGKGNFNFIIRGSDGKTKMFDENGITADGIPDGTIIGGMISDNTISKSKLDFPIIETDENGKISITQIKDGNGNEFGFTYNEFQESTKNSLNELDNKISNNSFGLRISASKGQFFNNGISETTLEAHLFQNNNEVTEDYASECFIWKRTSFDSSSDTYWNEQHSEGTKILTITKADVMYGANFSCTFSYNGETIASFNCKIK